MISSEKILPLIDLIYEAVLDHGLWPAAVTGIADAVGAPQVATPAFDWRSNIFSTVAPRFDPDYLAAYGQYWAFEEPVVPAAMRRPLGEIYGLGDLLPREDFAASPVFNEWWQPAGCGLAAMGANIVAEDGFTALICLWNAPGRDEFRADQYKVFEALVPHIGRAVRISRRHRCLELKSLAAAQGFDAMHEGAILADARARVVIANRAAKAYLDARDGVFLCEGRLTVNGTADALQRLVASCARYALTKGGPGGDLHVPRRHGKAPLHITVTPIRARARLLDYPWAGTGSPVAIISLRDRDLVRRRREAGLRRRFGLTFAEAAVANEIMRGDGRRAAAARCGISDETAKSHLKNIFGKTGTRRQAELIRVLAAAQSAGLPE